MEYRKIYHSFHTSSITFGSNNYTKDILFFEKLNIVADISKYEGGNKTYRLVGGTEESRKQVKEFIDNADRF